MDPLTALSTAGTVEQFIDFALKILTTGHQLYKLPTGSLPVHEELKLVARDLSTLTTKLNVPTRSRGAADYSQDDAVLQDLCEKCETIAQDLMEHLKSVKRQEKKGALKNFRLTLKVTWDQKDLDSLIQELQLLRKSLERWFLVDIG
jgi:hypothetical protein